MIASFRDKLTTAIFERSVPKGVSADNARAAYATMLVLDRAKSLQDLKGMSLSLEALKHDRAGQHSIRVSRSWRICSRWRDGYAHDVEFTNHYR